MVFLFSATKLQSLLEKRQLPAKILQDGNKSPKSESDFQDTLSMEDLATLLNNSQNLTKHLEKQVQFYQDTVEALQERSQEIVVENEMLYEKLKGNFTTVVLETERSNSSIKDQIRTGRQDMTVKQESEADKFQNRHEAKKQVEKETHTIAHGDENLSGPISFHDQQYQYHFNLEQEMDKIKKLNQKKTHRLESILQSTREELEKYRCETLKLQSQIRAFENDSEKRYGGMNGDVSVQPTDSCKNIVEKLTRERDELMATLAKHKSLLTQSQQHEFESYIEVKKSVETIEQAQLEKAEATIKIQQLRCSMEEDRKRHENVLASINRKTKQDCANITENYEKKIQDLKAEIEEQIQMRATTENQLERLSREKVNLMTSLEKAKAELTISQVDISKFSQDAKEEVVTLTCQHVKAQQEIRNLQNLQTQQTRQYEQEKGALVTENEELRQRLNEAQNAWVESREECMKTLVKFKKLENDLHMEKASKINLEKVQRDSSAFFVQQTEQREKQFLEIIDKKEKEHALLQRELEQILEAQIQIYKTVKEESKRISQKLEDKTQKHRLEKRDWRKQHSHQSMEIQILLKKHEVITIKNDKNTKVLQRLTVKVDSLKEDKRKAIKTIYELLKKQNGLLQDRQNLSHEVECLKSQVASISQSPILAPRHQMSSSEQASHNGTLSDDKPINAEEETEEESL